MSANPVALITGASRGIGKGIALELSRIGYDLLLNYARDQSAAEQTARECAAQAAQAQRPVETRICQADVGLGPDREKLMACARAEFGRLDLLINNAGIPSLGRLDILEATEENFDRLLAVNLKGPYFLTQLAARWMIAQAAATSSQAGSNTTPPRARKIINISSISAYTASVNRGDYCVAKAGLGMMTKLYAARLAEFGITVYEIRPGIMATDMTAPVKEKYDRLLSQGLIPIARWGTPQDVGKAVAAIALDLLPFSTGEVINVDGGFHLRRL